MTTTERQISEWIKHPVSKVVLQWVAANLDSLRAVDARFQTELAEAPQEIPPEFYKLAGEREHVFYESTPPAFHAAFMLIETALSRCDTSSPPDLDVLHLVLSHATVSALSAASPRQALAADRDAEQPSS